MGPQHIAAENAWARVATSMPDKRFNGAAAHRCGKLIFFPPRRAPQAASMGPQHIAAENLTGAGDMAAEALSFNGAAAHRCGKLSSAADGCDGDQRFNGAAAHRCGKPFSANAESL